MLSSSIFAVEKYYACIKLSDKSIASTWKQDEALPLKKSPIDRIIFEISQAEYESTVNQTTIDFYYNQAIENKKDFAKLDEILICAFIVLLEYQNGDVKTKTPAQFRTDVIAKYNARNS